MGHFSQLCKGESDETNGSVNVVHNGKKNDKSSEEEGESYYVEVG